MIRIRDIILPPEHDKNALLYCAAQALRIRSSDIASLQIFKRSLDARKKPELTWVYTVDVNLRKGERQLVKQLRNKKITYEEPYYYKAPKANSDERPVVVGFGPAGMFAALILAMSGLKPIVLERGQAVEERTRTVEAFRNGGPINPESNVQFGEGGAGTFSDGKLNTGTKNERIRWVLHQLVKAGAQEEILYDAKPHVGTDVLRYVVRNLRQRVLSLGGEIYFGAKLTKLHKEGDRLTGLTYEQDGEERMISCRHLILAIGHSARDTYRYLYDAGIPMEPKPFSMGVRIEHKQEIIDYAQYGGPRQKGIPPADY
ncbi:MAG: FAD-dependent monooxygenase, partial [Oscillospiraceae bacterium]|nr:FAD-dependent monooxygenase [Oscillospiraceae bacterium]